MNKKILFMFLILLNFVTSYAAYNIGDTVEDISFQEVDYTSGTAVYTDRSISELTAEGKTVVIYFVNFSFL